MSYKVIQEHAVAVEWCLWNKDIILTIPTFVFIYYTLS